MERVRAENSPELMKRQNAHILKAQQILIRGEGRKEERERGQNKDIEGKDRLQAERRDQLLQSNDNLTDIRF